MEIALVLLPSWATETPPIGIAYVASVLRKENHAVRVFDLNIKLWNEFKQQPAGYLWNEGSGFMWEFRSHFYRDVLHVVKPKLITLIDCILEKKPCAVGFSAYSTTINTVREAAILIRKKAPEVLIFSGGPAISQESISSDIEDGIFDAAIEGEGEETVVELISCWENQRNVSEIPGVIARDQNGKLTQGDARPYLPLNNIPLPDFDDFDLDLYRKRQLPVILSRGCVAACSFCTETMFWGKFRSRSAENIFRELRRGVLRYRTDCFFFNDSLINGRHDVLESLVDMILCDRLRITWGGNARFDRCLTPTLLKKMSEAGCTFLSFGLESGSQNVLDIMGKNISVRDANRIVRDTSIAGIQVLINLIIGFPGEEEKDLEETIQFIRRNHQFIRRVSPGVTLMIGPGMTLYKEPRRFGIAIDEDGRPAYDETGGWYTTDRRNTYNVRMKRLSRVRYALDEIFA